MTPGLLAFETALAADPLAELTNTAPWIPPEPDRPVDPPMPIAPRQAIDSAVRTMAARVVGPSLADTPGAVA